MSKQRKALRAFVDAVDESIQLRKSQDRDADLFFESVARGEPENRPKFNPMTSAEEFNSVNQAKQWSYDALRQAVEAGYNPTTMKHTIGLLDNLEELAGWWESRRGSLLKLCPDQNDEDAIYAQAVRLKNNGLTWTEVTQELNQPSVDAVRVGAARYAKQNKIKLVKGKPGRPGKK